MTIDELINECDSDGVPYFNEEEKSRLVQEWEQIEENFPIFSTQTFKDPQTADFQRMLSKISNPQERKEVEKNALRWSAQNRKPPTVYLQKYVTPSADTIPTSHVLDLTRGKQLDESFLRQFGWLIKKIMERMFGGSNVPVKVKGSKEQIKALSQVLAGEKEYMTKFHDLGLDNPQTFRSKAKLESAIQQFERATGLKWPFGDK